MITTDGLAHKFLLTEDVGTDKTWRPATTDDIKRLSISSNYKEAERLICVRTGSYCSIRAKTGNKKTTVLFGITSALFFSMGADVRFY